MIFFIAFLTENASIMKFAVFIIQWIAAVRYKLNVLGFQPTVS